MGWLRLARSSFRPANATRVPAVRGMCEHAEDPARPVLSRCHECCRSLMADARIPDPRLKLWLPARPPRVLTSGPGGVEAVRVRRVADRAGPRPSSPRSRSAGASWRPRSDDQRSPRRSSTRTRAVTPSAPSAASASACTTAVGRPPPAQTSPEASGTGAAHRGGFHTLSDLRRPWPGGPRRRSRVTDAVSDAATTVCVTQTTPACAK